MNCTFVVAASALYNAVFCVTDPQDADPAQLRLLPAAAGDRAAGHGGQRHASRALGRRQHRPAAEADRPPARGASPGRARSRRGRERRLELEPALRRRPPGDRPLLLATTTSTAWAPARRPRRTATTREITRHSNCRNTPVEVFEHRYPLLTLELRPRARLRRRREASRRARRPQRTLRITAPTRSPSARCSTAARSPPHRPVRRPARRVGSALAGQARRRRRSSSAFDERLRRRLADEVHQRRAAPRRRAPLPHAGRRAASATRPSATRRPSREDVREGYVSAGGRGARLRAARSPSRGGAMRQGEWVEPARAWHDTNVSYCEVCGRLIPRRAWVFDGGAGQLVACSPTARSSTRLLETKLWSDARNMKITEVEAIKIRAPRGDRHRHRRRQPGRAYRARPHRRGHRRAGRDRFVSRSSPRR